MSLTTDAGRKATQVQLDAAQQQQTVMTFLQSQQNMIQQLQMQLYGQSSPWNVGVMYRIPDTNFNPLSCVPNEYAAFLGSSVLQTALGQETWGCL